MKRSASSSLSSTPDLDASSDFAPSPPSSTLVITPTKGAAPRKKVKTEGGSNNIADGKDIKPKTSISGKKGGAAGGPWTPAKKLEFAELVISRGIASMSADDLAKQASRCCGDANVFLGLTPAGPHQAANQRRDAEGKEQPPSEVDRCGGARLGKTTNPI
jgi:hypothetical protein